MTTSPTQPARPPAPPTFRSVRVRRAERITPQVVRITVAGPDLEDFRLLGPAGHIRVFFPAPGQEAPPVPIWGPNGPVFPADQPRPVSRAYTPRRWNPATGELDIDMVLHGHGPGATWAAQARPGDALVIAGPRTAYQPDPQAGWHLLAGDATALPAIASILETLPAGAQALVLAEVCDEAEQQPLEARAQLQLTWLHHGPDTPLPGRLLEAALRETELPEGRGAVWLACEALVMRDIRRHLLYERGLARAALHTRGYWKAGSANHSDHDTGEEI